MSDEKPVYVSGSGKIKIKKWEFISILPLGLILLRGLVYGHPKFEDGEEIVSSPIIEMDLLSRSARTRSGSYYHLEDPNPDWIKWLEDNNHTEYLNQLFPN